MAGRIRPRADTAASSGPADKKLKGEVGEGTEDADMVSKELEELSLDKHTAEILLKSNLQLHQSVRRMMAGLWATFLVPSNTLVVAGADEVGKDYNKKIKELGSGHNLGSPHGMIFLGSLEAAQGEEEVPELREPIRKLYKALETKDRVWVETAVWHFSAKAIYKGKGKDKDGDKNRDRHVIHLGLDPFSNGDLEGLPEKGIQQATFIKQLFGKYATAHGGEVCTGPPPRGTLERILQEKLTKLQKKRGKK